ncbi:MAG TPA: FAD-dependent oxidoreductase, partial [Candidatus Microsaccharimonas sp.]|nr:FAD-dependent oxidoreductase [Candidatus Microsaccharimonas sp.]
MTLKFTGSQPVTGNVVSFSFAPDEPLQWLPGQYMHYVLPHAEADDRGTERWFTNSAAPSEGKVMISTRIDAEHGSSFKRALQNLKPGDTVEADGPEGDFTVDDESRNYLFVAGGIGITPFRSMLAQAHTQGKQLHATVLYANRDQDVPFKDELEQYAVDNPALQIEYFVSPKTLDPQQIKQYADKLENPLVYLSGPE